MSEVHVYGVVPAADAAGPAPDGARHVVHRDVAALVGDVASERPSAAGVLRTHWRVLEEASADATVLPVRFGTVMAGDEAVVDAFLAPGHDDLASRLAEMVGKVQLTVRAFYDEESLLRGVVERSPHVARLRAQVSALPEAAAYYKRIELGQLVAAEVEQARERDTAVVLARLEPLALAARREQPSSLDAAVNTAFLVERARMDDFSRAVGELGHELSGRMRLRYAGPLPPYSFTGEDATVEAAWA
jgi:hypothetical protein